MKGRGDFMKPIEEDDQELHYDICRGTELIESAEIFEYGIVCKDRQNTVVEKIENISTEYDFVAQLVSKLNEGEVEACHFLDIVEDAIC